MWSWFRNARVQTKLSLVLVLTTALTLGAVASILIVEFGAARESLARELESVADVVGASSSAALSFADHRGAEENLEAFHADARIASAALYNVGGQVLAKYPRQGSVHEAPLENARDAWRRFEG